MTVHLKKWFWQWEWGPEPNRYLKEIWPRLNASQKTDLVSSIFAGPDNQTQDKDWINRRIYGMLKAIDSVSDDTEIIDHLHILEKQFSHLNDWQIEGFSVWHSSTPTMNERIAQTEDELVEQLQKPSNDDMHLDVQSDLIREYLIQPQSNTIQLLKRLTAECILSDQMLATVLDELSEKDNDTFLVCECVDALPSGEHPRVAFALARLLRLHAKEKNPKNFNEIWPLAYNEGSKIQFDVADQPGDGIDYPLGRVSDALFSYLSTLELKADTQFPPFPRDALLSLIEVSPGRGAAVSEIASRIAFLHAVEPELAKLFLWIFDWKNTEAPLAWKSFLSHPHWHQDLFLVLDNDFRQTIKNVDMFDDNTQQMLGWQLAQKSAIESLISLPDAATLLRPNNRNVLQGIAECLANHVKSTDSRLRDDLWTNTLKPWFQESWPASAATGNWAWAMEQVSKALAEICAHLSGTFGDAVATFGERIGRVPHLYIVKPLLEGDKVEQFPTELASLLERLTRDGIHHHVPTDLSELLTRLKLVAPELPNVKRLSDRLVAATT